MATAAPQADDDRRAFLDPNSTPRTAVVSGTGGWSFGAKAAVAGAAVLALCLGTGAAFYLARGSVAPQGSVAPPEATGPPHFDADMPDFGDQATGEDVCEDRGLNEKECEAKGCCEFDDGDCWSAVGDGPCPESGHQVCEDHGLNEKECEAKGCCEFDEGACWSAVGDGPCPKSGHQSATGPQSAPAPTLAPPDCGKDAGKLKAAPLPAELAAYRQYFEKYVPVFGIPIIAEEGVPDWKLEHAANVMAQYLDYDQDGEVNNKEVLQSVIRHRGLILMFEEPGSDTMEAVFSSDIDGQDLNDPDIPRHSKIQHHKKSNRRLGAPSRSATRRLRSSANGTRSRVRHHTAGAVFAKLPKCLDGEVPRHVGSVRDCEKDRAEKDGEGREYFEFGRMDASLEEILHMLWDSGYSKVYPGAFGLRHSEMTDAMDKQIADCGNAYDGTLKYPEPGCSGTYHYEDDTCDYGCLAVEYQYWTLTSILGAQDGTAWWATGSQDGQCGNIKDEWELCSKSDIQAKDPAILALYDLEGENKYKVPNRLPRGNYSPKKMPSECDMVLHPEYHSYHHARVRMRHQAN